MSLIMQKSYRSKLDSAVNNSMVFGVIFSFLLIGIGIGSYVIPEFGIDIMGAVGLVVLGAGILLFSLSSIIMKMSAGMSRSVSILIALLSVTFILLMALIGSGILEVNF